MVPASRPASSSETLVAQISHPGAQDHQDGQGIEQRLTGPPSYLSSLRGQKV